ncbi:hypothetical protein [Rhodanobacter sp. L36]|uniref:hypothetical protein n=1 Tax=Rhodanobacter sp. L36 TaxID=1747221 RepID=UPI00131CEDE5|nr:hypothetical protein [Rhodanobacter sp. L36]
MVCLLIGALYSLYKGQDADWDLKNYHLYNCWALLHDRLNIDLGAAGIQAYFNPLLDLPYYLLGTGVLKHLPRVLAALQGLWYGGLIFFLLQIAVRLSGLHGRSFGVIDLLAVLIGATGTMAMSQAGLSSNEMPLALLMLAGIHQLLPLCAAELPSRAWRHAVIAGCLCGMAVGLKPTAMIYPPALGLALLFALGARATAWRLSALFALGTCAGFLLTYGWWGWTLFELTGNPTFPMFNQWFHSPLMPANSGTDVRFLPRSTAQWLFYPFYWIRPSSGLVTESPVADARIALTLLAIVGLAAMAWLRRARPSTERRAVRLLTIFVTAGYVLWLGMFSILRYTVSIEVLSGLIMLLAVQELPGSQRADGSARRWPAWTMLCLFLLLAGSSTHPDWGHAPYADVAFDVHAPAVEPGSMVVLVGAPQAYVIPFIDRAQASQYLGLTNLTKRSQNHGITQATRERLLAYRGPTYALLRDDAGEYLAMLKQWLPGAKLTDCSTIRSNLEHDQSNVDVSSNLRLCRLQRS